MEANVKERNSIFEILRIISIIFIIAHHLSVHGCFDFVSIDITTTVFINRVFIDLLAQLGKIGVNLFILTSSYFLIDGNRFKSRKIIYLFLEMLIFSCVIGFTFVIRDNMEMSYSLLVTIIFPVGSTTWWFMTSYLFLYILSPFLNLGIRAMKKEMHLAFTIILLALFSLLPTLLVIGYDFTMLPWFIALYFVASYLKIYGLKFNNKPQYGILIAISLFLVEFIIKCCFYYIPSTTNPFLERMVYRLSAYYTNNFIGVVSTILFFYSFSKINIKSNKVINLISSTTLAIYLYHDHKFMRTFLWVELFKMNDFVSSPLLILYSIGIILSVFIVGVIIGLIYRYSFGLLTNKMLNVLDRKILYKLDNNLNNQTANEQLKK